MSFSGISLTSGSQVGASASQAGAAAAPVAKIPPHKAIRCHICGDLFPSEERLTAHRVWAMKLKKTHIHCPVCNMDFNTMEGQAKHMQEMHAQEQDIKCPGCERPFVRLAGLMHHLEHNECPKIRREDVDRNRAEKLSFAHELEKRSGSQFGDYFPISHPSVQSAVSVASKPYMAHPSFFKPSDFPAPDKSEGDAGSTASGSIASTAAPDATATASASKVDDLDNPSHPGFNVNKYYNQYSRKYKCPKASCNKTFPSGKALVGHMMQTMSHYNAKLQCPGCLRWFKDASSLTAHSESETNRCSIRHSDNYRVYLDQLTGGIADVVGKHADNSIKYEVSNEAVIKFGTAQQAKRATENMAKKQAERQESWRNVNW